jgi:hypothetical protein
MPKAKLLTADQERGLLIDIEENDCLLHEIDFESLCDQKAFFYGPRTKQREGQRRNFQKRFDTIKRLTPQGYKRLLASHHIPPNKARATNMTKTSKWEEPVCWMSNI